MKIVPGLWPRRHEALKIGRSLEAAAWLAAAGLALAIVVTGTLTPNASATPARPTGISRDLAAGIYPRTCVKRVVDLTRSRSEPQIVAEINRQCFKPATAGTASDRQPAPTCVNALTRGPALGAAPRLGLCFRQSTSGWHR